MTDRATPDPLSAARHFVLVLRLVVRADGDLRGEILDPETQDMLPFAGSIGLTAAVEEWLARRTPGGRGAAPDDKGGATA